MTWRDWVVACRRPPPTERRLSTLLWSGTSAQRVRWDAVPPGLLHTGAPGPFFNKGWGGQGQKSRSLNLNRGAQERGRAHNRSCLSVLRCMWIQARGLRCIKVRQVPLLWRLSDISAICNFWPQIQILGRTADPPPWPNLPEPLIAYGVDSLTYVVQSSVLCIKIVFMLNACTVLLSAFS